jgi:hypothetical protein
MNKFQIALAEFRECAKDMTDEQWALRDEDVRSARDAEEARQHETKQNELRRDLVERGCPAKDLERAISGYMVDTTAVKASRDALERSLVLLVLSGLRGCGKTTAASWWLLQRREPSKYVRTGPPRFVDASALSRWPRYEEAKMVELERASALVIDDLGVEYDDKNGAFRSFLDGLVNSRYAACLPTVITTNLRATEFKARYGERIADRVREAGRYVELADPSMRGKA